MARIDKIGITDQGSEGTFEFSPRPQIISSPTMTYQWCIYPCLAVKVLASFKAEYLTRSWNYPALLCMLTLTYDWRKTTDTTSCWTNAKAELSLQKLLDNRYIETGHWGRGMNRIK